ncbi:MAG: maltose ABC transporter permease MalF, partial [Pantoea sp.]|nr:maltose ABC transporter permease MalF [Pantoea sp.]
MAKSALWWQRDALKWLVLALCVMITGYLVVLMYAQGEYLFAIVTLILLSSGLIVFFRRHAQAWRYVWPGLAGMMLFVLFPLACTIAIAFTNYSSTNQLSFERARQVLMDRQFQAGDSYAFSLWSTADKEWRLLLKSPDDKQFITPPFSLAGKGEQTLTLTETQQEPAGKRAMLRDITQNRQALAQLTAHLPDGTQLRMSSLRQFSGTQPLYRLGEDNSLTDKQTGKVWYANDDTGFWQAKDASQQWTSEKLSPGYTVTVGWDNFLRVLTDKGIQQPFIAIFIWTVIFAALTVLLTVAVGMVLACLMQWEALKGRAVYRLLMILPYAVPAFISILIFKGLFNQSFG